MSIESSLEAVAGPFGIIISDHSLEHLPDPGEGLRFFAGVTEPGARLVLTHFFDSKPFSRAFLANNPA